MINSTSSAAVAQGAEVELASTAGVITAQPTGDGQATTQATTTTTASRQANRWANYYASQAAYDESSCRKACYKIAIGSFAGCGVGQACVVPIIACAQAGGAALTWAVAVSYGLLGLGGCAYACAGKPSPPSTPVGGTSTYNYVGSFN